MEDEPSAAEEETQKRPAAADRTYTDSTDLYEVLGVSKAATTAEIKVSETVWEDGIRLTLRPTEDSIQGQSSRASPGQEHGC